MGTLDIRISNGSIIFLIEKESNSGRE